jgi:hypothetical protein
MPNEKRLQLVQRDLPINNNLYQLEVEGEEEVLVQKFVIGMLVMTKHNLKFSYSIKNVIFVRY